MAGAFIKRTNAELITEGKLPQPKRRGRAGMKKGKDKFSDSAITKEFDSPAAASAASGGGE